MRATTIVLCIGVFVGALLLVGAAVTIGLLCGVSRLFTLSEWSVESMAIESFDYSEDSIHMRVVLGARAWSSNETRASSITIPVAGGSFALALNGVDIGTGEVGRFSLSHDIAGVELVLDQSGIPLDRGDIFKEYIAGKAVTVTVQITKLDFLLVPLSVERNATASMLITDGVQSISAAAPKGAASTAPTRAPARRKTSSSSTRSTPTPPVHIKHKKVPLLF